MTPFPLVTPFPLANGAIAAGQQHLRDGQITSTTGILLAMVPAGDKLAEKDGWWVDKYRNVIGAGLAMLEADIRDNESPLGWNEQGVKRTRGQV